jgi:hypothetical protein
MFSKIRTAGNYHVSQPNSSSKRYQVRTAVMLGILIAVHYCIIKIIDNFSAVPVQPERIDEIQLLFVKENAVEICCPFKQFSTCQSSGRQLSNFVIYAVSAQSLEINPNPLPETGPLGVISNDK